VKKTFGVTGSTLAMQFIGESVMLAFMSWGIALIIAFLLLPNFNALTGKDLH